MSQICVFNSLLNLHFERPSPKSPGLGLSVPHQRWAPTEHPPNPNSAFSQPQLQPLPAVIEKSLSFPLTQPAQDIPQIWVFTKLADKLHLINCALTHIFSLLDSSTERTWLPTTLGR